MNEPYLLAPLLTLGATDIYTNPWPDYVSWLGLTEDHVPDLLRIVLETPWEGRDWDNEPDAWAPIHAWRAIAQLRSQRAVQPLIELIDRSTNNEWVWAEIPYVYAAIGPLAIPALTKYVTENGQKYATAYTAISALSQIGQYYPDARPLITVFLTDRLSKAQENHPSVNSYLVRALVELKADEAVPTIREAYEESLVDESVSGEWHDVLVAFGLAEPVDSSPLDKVHRPNQDAQNRGETAHGAPMSSSSRPKDNKKDKNKRKQAKKDKKANRRK